MKFQDTVKCVLKYYSKSGKRLHELSVIGNVTPFRGGGWGWCCSVREQNSSLMRHSRSSRSYQLASVYVSSIVDMGGAG